MLQLPPPHRGKHSFCDVGRGRDVGGGQDGQELLAPPAAEEVSRATARAADRLRDGHQAGIASRVAVGVVVGLEVIDIDHQRGDGDPIPPAAIPLRAEHLGELPPVGKSREWVGGGEFLPLPGRGRVLGLLGHGDLDGDLQFPGPERLDEKSERRHLERARQSGLVGLGGQEHDGRVASEADAAGRVDAVTAIGQADVHQDHVWLLTNHGCQRVVGSGGDAADVVSQGSEPRRQRGRGERLVLDDEHAAGTDRCH